MTKKKRAGGVKRLGRRRGEDGEEGRKEGNEEGRTRMNGPSSECRPVCPSPISIHSVPRHPDWTLEFHPATGFGIQHSTAREFISMVTLGMFLLLLHLPASLPPSFQRSKTQPHHEELVPHPSWKSQHFAAPEQDKGLIRVPKASCFLLHEEQAIPEKEALSTERLVQGN